MLNVANQAFSKLDCNEMLDSACRPLERAVVEPYCHLLAAAQQRQSLTGPAYLRATSYLSELYQRKPKGDSIKDAGKESEISDLFFKAKHFIFPTTIPEHGLVFWP